MFPALLSGNCILIKPAEDTPLSALYIGQLAAEAGFPPGVINVLPGRGEITGQAIAEHPGVRYISFTRFHRVWASYYAHLRCAWHTYEREMGGNGAAIVLAMPIPMCGPHDWTLYQPALRSDLLHDSSYLRRQEDCGQLISMLRRVSLAS